MSKCTRNTSLLGTEIITLPNVKTLYCEPSNGGVWYVRNVHGDYLAGPMTLDEAVAEAEKRLDAEEAYQKCASAHPTYYGGRS